MTQCRADCLFPCNRNDTLAPPLPRSETRFALSVDFVVQRLALELFFQTIQSFHKNSDLHKTPNAEVDVSNLFMLKLVIGFRQPLLLMRNEWG